MSDLIIYLYNNHKSYSVLFLSLFLQYENIVLKPFDFDYKLQTFFLEPSIIQYQKLLFL